MCKNSPDEDEFALCYSSLWSGLHGDGEQQDRVEQDGCALHLERVRHAILRGERRLFLFARLLFFSNPKAALHNVHVMILYFTFNITFNLLYDQLSF